ncbi:MAG: DUF885 family protein, partial [Ginsengibacter sp.]
MTRSFLNFLFSISIIASAINCKAPAKKENDIAHFHSMLANYWNDTRKLQPLDATMFGDNSLNDQFVNTCTQAYRNEVKNFIMRYLDSAKIFNPENMNEEDELSYKVLTYDLNMKLEGSKYDTWKIPFTQMGDAGNTLSGNIVLAIGQYGSGKSAQPFKTVEDYGNWLKRVHAYTTWCDSAIENFRQGMATNYVLPKALVVKMINICNGLISANETKSIFYGPIKNFPATFSAVEKDSITPAYKTAIKNELNPAHAKLALFLKNEYLPKARITSGVSYLPNGLNYYKFCAKNWTTTDKTLDEIYNTGLNEVKRIRQEMEDTKNSSGYKGDLKSFFEFMKTSKQFMPFKTPEEVLDSFRHIYEIIKPSLKKYFVLLPKSQFEIRQTEAFRA